MPVLRSAPRFQFNVKQIFVVIFAQFLKNEQLLLPEKNGYY